MDKKLPGICPICMTEGGCEWDEIDGELCLVCNQKPKTLMEKTGIVAVLAVVVALMAIVAAMR